MYMLSCHILLEAYFHWKFISSNVLKFLVINSDKLEFLKAPLFIRTINVT